MNNLISNNFSLVTFSPGAIYIFVVYIIFEHLIYVKHQPYLEGFGFEMMYMFGIICIPLKREPSSIYLRD